MVKHSSDLGQLIIGPRSDDKLTQVRWIVLQSAQGRRILF